uniref:Zasp-like motif domain-containing protein n=1 Tax=Anopheles atroparvus TaxID=41427 RepID=A0AAG5D809_ANOAO
MMAYHQRISQYRTPRRIDFDDPSTTKPPSLAKSAVLAALEEEEREKSRGTGRQSRSRQSMARLQAPPATPCIDRETVLKINRRSLQRRHRSCENVWPPRPSPSEGHHQRHPSPTGNTRERAGLEGRGTQQQQDFDQEFAIGGGRRYGSHDSVYFDERVRRQHKIEPLRTLFDKENVVLTDWGHRPTSAPANAPEGVAWVYKNDNHVYGDGHNEEEPGFQRPLDGSKYATTQEGNRTDDGRSLQDMDQSGGCDERLHRLTTPRRTARFEGDFRSDGLEERLNRAAAAAAEATKGECNHHYNHHWMEAHPPVPPPRRYYLPMDKIAGGELEATVRLFQDMSITTGQLVERRSATPSHEWKPSGQQHERSKSAQEQPMPAQDRANQAAGLLRDGIESKPPLKLKSASGRTTPRTRGPSPVGVSGGLQRHQTFADVSSIEETSAVQRPNPRDAMDNETIEGTRRGAPDVGDTAGRTWANDEFNINSNTEQNLTTAERSSTPACEPAGLQLHRKPPKHGHSIGSPSPTPLTSAVNLMPPTVTSPAPVQGADQLPTANYFDKQWLRHPNETVGSSQPVRFPLATGGLDQFVFPLRAELEAPEKPPAGGRSHGVDHKFDSSVQLTGTPTTTLEEIHNYNEKLITDTTGSRAMTAAIDAGATTPRPTAEGRCWPPHSSALNVANQPNRNWINLNSNQIYHQQRSGATGRALADRDCQRVSPVLALPGGRLAGDVYPTTGDHGDRHPGGDAATNGTTDPERPGETGRTHVAYGSDESGPTERRPHVHREGPHRAAITTATTAAENANDNLQRHFRRGEGRPRTDYNYDNKSVRSHYRPGASPVPPPADNARLPDDAPQRYVTPSPPPPPFPEPQLAPERRPRARSGSSGSSVKINEIFEFPPPPPYPCDCGGPDGEGEPLAGWATEEDRRTNVNEFESDRMRAGGDTGRDYATSEYTYHPTAVGTTPTRNQSVHASVCPQLSEQCAGDNDVTNAGGGHDQPRRSRALQRTPLPDGSQRNVSHPGALGTEEKTSFDGRATLCVVRSRTPAPGVNVGSDYFRTNFTAGEPSLTNANTVRNLGEEQNKYRTGTMVDKSIGDDRGRQCSSAANRSDLPTDAGAYAKALGEQLQPPASAPVPRMISFTDGEFIFGPIDERALEFERFELLSDGLAPRTVGEGSCTCSMTGFDEHERKSDPPTPPSRHGSPEQLASPGAPSADAAGTDVMSNLSARTPESNPGDPEDRKLICATRVQVNEEKEAHVGTGGGDDGGQNIAAFPTTIERPDANPRYERWARFENGNISPPPAGNNATDTSDGRSSKRLTRGDEIEEIFQQLNQSLKANVTKGASGGSNEKLHDALAPASFGGAIGQLVENVPVIDSILDDLLTFSKQLLRKQQLAQERQRLAAAVSTERPPTEAAIAETTDGLASRAKAQLAEINDDNLINLLADGNDAGKEDVDDRRDAVDKSRNNEREDNDSDAATHRERPGGSIEGENENAKTPANNDQHSNQLHGPGDASVEEDENWNVPAPQEDIFTNVAIFNWNPLDVYQQHGLFMIDPRFALADMRAVSPAHPHSSEPPLRPLPIVPEELDTPDTGDDEKNDSDTRRPHQQPGASIASDGLVKEHERDAINNSLTMAADEVANVKFPLHQTRAHGQSFPAAPATSSVAAANWKMNTCRNYCQDSDDPLTTTGSDRQTIVEHDQRDKIVQMNQVLHVYDACHVRYPLDGSDGNGTQEEHCPRATTATTPATNEPTEGIRLS